jgi:hypothetical protein
MEGYFTCSVKSRGLLRSRNISVSAATCGFGDMIAGAGILGEFAGNVRGRIGIDCVRLG